MQHTNAEDNTSAQFVAIQAGCKEKDRLLKAFIENFAIKNNFSKKNRVHNVIS